YRQKDSKREKTYMRRQLFRRWKIPSYLPFIKRFSLTSEEKDLLRSIHGLSMMRNLSKISSPTLFLAGENKVKVLEGLEKKGFISLDIGGFLGTDISWKRVQAKWTDNPSIDFAVVTPAKQINNKQLRKKPLANIVSTIILLILGIDSKNAGQVCPLVVSQDTSPKQTTDRTKETTAIGLEIETGGGEPILEALKRGPVDLRSLQREQLVDTRSNRIDAFLSDMPGCLDLLHSLKTYLLEPLKAGNEELAAARKQQIIKMFHNGISLGLSEKIMAVQLARSDVVDNLTKGLFNFYFEIYMDIMYPTRLDYSSNHNEALKSNYKNLDEGEKGLLAKKGITTEKMYGDFSNTLLDSLKKEMTSVITAKGEFYIKKRGLLFLAGEEKQTQQKVFIVYLPSIAVAQVINLDEDSGKCIPEVRLHCFEEDAQARAWLDSFNNLTKLSHDSPWERFLNTYSLGLPDTVTPKRLLQLAEMGLDNRKILHLTKEGNVESRIKSLIGLGLQKEQGYLINYIVDDINNHNANKRISQVENLCQEDGLLEQYQLNFILSLFYEWAAWVDGFEKEEKRNQYANIYGIIDFKLWLEGIEKYPKQIELSPQFKTVFRENGASRHKLSEKEYAQLASAIVKVITAAETNISLNNITIEQNNIIVFCRRMGNSWQYVFYDKKWEFSAVVDEKGRIIELCDRILKRFSRNELPIIDGSRLKQGFCWAEDNFMSAQIDELQIEQSKEIKLIEPVQEDKEIINRILGPIISEEKALKSILTEKMTQITNLMANWSEENRLKIEALLNALERERPELCLLHMLLYCYIIDSPLSSENIILHLFKESRKKGNDSDRYIIETMFRYAEDKKLIFSTQRRKGGVISISLTDFAKAEISRFIEQGVISEQFGETLRWREKGELYAELTIEEMKHSQPSQELENIIVQMHSGERINESELSKDARHLIFRHLQALISDEDWEWSFPKEIANEIMQLLLASGIEEYIKEDILAYRELIAAKASGDLDSFKSRQFEKLKEIAYYFANQVKILKEAGYAGIRLELAEMQLVNYNAEELIKQEEMDRGFLDNFPPDLRDLISQVADLLDEQISLKGTDKKTKNLIKHAERQVQEKVGLSKKNAKKIAAAIISSAKFKEVLAIDNEIERLEKAHCIDMMYGFLYWLKNSFERNLGIKEKDFLKVFVAMVKEGKYTPSGSISRGKKSFNIVLENIKAGEFEEITQDKRLRDDIKAINVVLEGKGKHKLDVPARVILTDAVAIEENDFVLGFYSHAPPLKEKLISLLGSKDTFNKLFSKPTSILSRQMLNQPDNSIRQEYIYHELICGRETDHYNAIKLAQDIFPENYTDIENHPKGKLKKAIRDCIVQGLENYVEGVFIGRDGDGTSYCLIQKLGVTVHVEVINNQITVAFPAGNSGFHLKLDNPASVKTRLKAKEITPFADPFSGHNGVSFLVETNQQELKLGWLMGSIREIREYEKGGDGAEERKKVVPAYIENLRNLSKSTIKELKKEGVSVDDLLAWTT
ncbi:MAG: hypothetical protein KAS87_01025, partial [Candidatus Omnitrophica bacterium]|nr:hypothetical protein [Candidatus Omnitrophota bacterium]